MAPKRKPQSAAVLTIKRPGAMTAVGRAEIARWLRRQGENLRKYGKQYATTRFTARYMY